MFSYKLNCRILEPPSGEPTHSALRVEEINGDTPDGRVFSRSVPLCEKQVTKYPLLWIPRVKQTVKEYKEDTRKTELEKPVSIEPQFQIKPEPGYDTVDSSFQINVQLDFGKWFTWLERGIWITMIASIAWALALDTKKATEEVCYRNSTEHYPLNFLPSLSRTMGSFRIGTLFWTICMATCFIARLISNYFLHKLYEAWYESNWWNIVFLRIAYCLDNLEIISLIMIPAYSLECDWIAHRVAFIVYIVLTYLAEILQYFTRFLKRKKGLVLFTEDISAYYRQIGILIILQTLCLLWLLVGFYLHEYVCGDYHFTVFTLGEYLTVIVNVRFKRDTILFVK